ncbi:integrin beta pat-3-like [Palaemon carinicauda]|uniref:integrin beta pat-3-like n=1 Tax=Palaemon carinicauda TaxID=392227 RepID=UPI0035B66CA1
MMDFDERLHPIHRTTAAVLPGPNGSSGSSPGPELSFHARTPSSPSYASPPGYSRSSGSSGHVKAEVPKVIDLEWVRANLSALWSVVRSLTRQQGRPFIHRGSRGRHHHSGVVASPPDPDACPGTEDACRSEGTELCGGHGVCSCGHCFCTPGYYGTFCQCDDHSCPVYDGMTCGGPSRGQCRCGGCVCRPGYAGDSCDCPTETQTCFSPDSDEICSGKGTCSCGRCRCNDGHKGMYCEDTVYAAGVCEKLKSCVMCRAWNRDLPSCAHCQITVTTVESLEPSMTTCVMVNSGCLLQFSYIPQTADAYTVLVPRDMACPAHDLDRGPV